MVEFKVKGFLTKRTWQRQHINGKHFCKKTHNQQSTTIDRIIEHSYYKIVNKNIYKLRITISSKKETFSYRTRVRSQKSSHIHNAVTRHNIAPGLAVFPHYPPHPRLEGTLTILHPLTNECRPRTSSLNKTAYLISTVFLRNCDFEKQRAFIRHTCLSKHFVLIQDLLYFPIRRSI